LLDRRMEEESSCACGWEGLRIYHYELFVRDFCDNERVCVSLSQIAGFRRNSSLFSVFCSFEVKCQPEAVDLYSATSRGNNVSPPETSPCLHSSATLNLLLPIEALVKNHHGAATASPHNRPAMVRNGRSRSNAHGLWRRSQTAGGNGTSSRRHNHRVRPFRPFLST
jgi:hypothetical protein